MDCDTAVKTRTRLLDLVEAEGAAVIPCYFPLAESGQVIRIEECRYWQGGLVWPHPSRENETLQRMVRLSPALADG